MSQCQSASMSPLFSGSVWLVPVAPCVWEGPETDLSCVSGVLAYCICPLCRGLPHQGFHVWYVYVTVSDVLVCLSVEWVWGGYGEHVRAVCAGGTGLLRSDWVGCSVKHTVPTLSGVPCPICNQIIDNLTPASPLWFLAFSPTAFSLLDCGVGPSMDSVRVFSSWPHLFLPSVCRRAEQPAAMTRGLLLTEVNWCAAQFF